MESPEKRERKELRFVADNMLGKLARWLRMMGYDTLYTVDEDDAEITRLAASEDRLLLTRDRQLIMRKGVSAYYVEDIELEIHLKSVSTEFGLNFDEERMRCSDCNGELLKVDRESVDGAVPEGVFERNQTFYRCGQCGKIYWKGSHWKRILDVLVSVTSGKLE